MRRAVAGSMGLLLLAALLLVMSGCTDVATLTVTNDCLASKFFSKSSASGVQVTVTSSWQEASGGGNTDSALMKFGQKRSFIAIAPSEGGVFGGATFAVTAVLVDAAAGEEKNLGGGNWTVSKDGSETHAIMELSGAQNCR